jgi:hypothetical protein
MDPYIERPEVFPDFHDHLVTVLKIMLQPHLRPRYAAVMRDRIYIVEAEQVRFPDVAVVRTQSHQPAETNVALLDVDKPAVFQVIREEIRETYVEIVEIAAGNRMVTAIEVLSPHNKQPGRGREAYLEKRDQYVAAEANIVEIDLLRGGEPTVPLRKKEFETLGPWRYLVSVYRSHPTKHEVYAFPLEQRLPKIAVPLAYGDKDVPLDLQAAFSRCWEEGGYPELLRYHDAPPGELSEEELRWCREQLVKSGYAGVS